VLAAKLAVAGALATTTGLAATGIANTLCGAVLGARTHPLVPFADGVAIVLGTGLAGGLVLAAEMAAVTALAARRLRRADVA
jgi:hypothetical protein